MKLRNLPKIFQIESTSICNLRCTMCPHPQISRPKIHMDWELFTRIADNLVPTQKVGLHVLGEPLLHPRIVGMIAYLANRKVKVEFATNCTIMTMQLAKRLIAAGLSTIWFSFDSADPSLYESIRVGANYQKSLENVLLFLELNKSLGNPVKSIIQKVGPVTSAKDSKAFLKMWEGWDARVKFIDSWAGTMNLDKIEKPPVDRLPCAEPWNRVAVLANGAVVPCCRDWMPKYSYGNIRSSTLFGIWHGDRAEELRYDIVTGTYSIEPCASCCEWYIKMDREVARIE